MLTEDTPFCQALCFEWKMPELWGEGLKRTRQGLPTYPGEQWFVSYGIRDPNSRQRYRQAAHRRGPASQGTVEGPRKPCKTATKAGDLCQEEWMDGREHTKQLEPGPEVQGCTG